MKEIGVLLEHVSLCYRRYFGPSGGLKEAVMRAVTPRARRAQYEQLWGLNDVNLYVRPGDRLGIIGPNGAGKSSLLKVISGIYAPTEGSAKISGRIAPLIEIGAGFIPELSGRDNAYLYGSILGLKRQIIRERLADIAQFSGLEEFLDTPVKYYSTGMHQRLAFTIATEVAPDILILDEMYAGGDAAFIAKANRRLDTFVARSPILILVAHDMEYVRRFCNRVIVMDRGKIVLEAKPEEAIQRHLASAQIDVSTDVGEVSKASESTASASGAETPAAL